MPSVHHFGHAALTRMMLFAFGTGLFMGAIGGTILVGSIANMASTSAVAAAPTSLEDLFSGRSPGTRPAGVMSSKRAVTEDMIVAPVPEPQTWVMMIFGFGAIGAKLRRDRSSRETREDNGPRRTGRTGRQGPTSRKALFSFFFQSFS